MSFCSMFIKVFFESFGDSDSLITFQHPKLNANSWLECADDGLKNISVIVYGVGAVHNSPVSSSIQRSARNSFKARARAASPLVLSSAAVTFLIISICSSFEASQPVSGVTRSAAPPHGSAITARPAAIASRMTLGPMSMYPLGSEYQNRFPLSRNLGTGGVFFGYLMNRSGTAGTKLGPGIM